MKQRGSSLLVGVLLVVFGAIIALGIASYWQSISYQWGQGQQYHEIGVGRGSIYIISSGTIHDAIEYGADNGFRHANATDDFAGQRASNRRMADRDWWLPGLEWVHWTPDSDGPSAFEYGNAVYVSVWLVLLVALAAAARMWRTIRKNRRVLAGMCAACGYDLRATPDRCPECGTF